MSGAIVLSGNCWRIWYAVKTNEGTHSDREDSSRPWQSVPREDYHLVCQVLQNHKACVDTTYHPGSSLYSWLQQDHTFNMHRLPFSSTEGWGLTTDHLWWGSRGLGLYSESSVIFWTWRPHVWSLLTLDLTVFQQYDTCLHMRGELRCQLDPVLNCLDLEVQLQQLGGGSTFNKIIYDSSVV